MVATLNQGGEPMNGRTMVVGIERTARKLQPYNVWKDGKIIFFAHSVEEAWNDGEISFFARSVEEADSALARGLAGAVSTPEQGSPPVEKRVAEQGGMLHCHCIIRG